MEKLIADKLHIPLRTVTNVLTLMDDGATIPFIARYRKEMTGGKDETVITRISEERDYFTKINTRKETILKRLEELNINDPRIISKINDCFDAVELEDLYLPFRPKRKTRASKARELGLEPIARMVMSQRGINWRVKIAQHTRGKISDDDAIQGAKDIIAEWVNEHQYARKIVRKTFSLNGIISSRVIKSKMKEATKYQDYFDFTHRIKGIPGHRLLAVMRGEKEGYLRIKLTVDSDNLLNRLYDIFIKSPGNDTTLIQEAIADGFKRLMVPSIEKETLNMAKEQADDEAIDIFGENLKQLLLSAPLGMKKTMAIDPGFRTGCKVVCLDESGSLLHHTTIFPHPPQNDRSVALSKMDHLLSKYKIEAVAIGNGTAGRETYQMITQHLEQSDIEVYSVNEDGASIYSASDTGREEFPHLDLTVRGAISIGRRLMDPLSELVKIDPKSIGVGQYQHDVAQDRLRERLDHTVVTAVNQVGVNLNTAGYHVLKYISGIGPQLAKRVVEYRNKNGIFQSRKELKNVPGLGPKAFQQAAGFLRITNGQYLLDSSGVHPERYPLVEKMACDLNLKLADLIRNQEKIDQVNINQYVTSEVGIPTLNDIISELKKPGLDPRGKARVLVYEKHVRSFEDLKVGMKLNGKITNLTRFGAFTDIGIKENGLIHISQITDRFIKDPAEVLQLNQAVRVRVIGLDESRKRIQLTLKDVD